MSMITEVRINYYERQEPGLSVKRELIVPVKQIQTIEVVGDSGFGVKIMISDDGGVIIRGDNMHILPASSNQIVVIGENPHE